MLDDSYIGATHNETLENWGRDIAGCNEKTQEIPAVGVLYEGNAERDGRLLYQEWRKNFIVATKGFPMDRQDWHSLPAEYRRAWQETAKTAKDWYQ